MMKLPNSDNRTLDWNELTPELKATIQGYYKRKQEKHPNMSLQRIMKLCGRKFNINFITNEPAAANSK